MDIVKLTMCQCHCVQGRPVIEKRCVRDRPPDGRILYGLLLDASEKGTLLHLKLTVFKVNRCADIDNFMTFQKEEKHVSLSIRMSTPRFLIFVVVTVIIFSMELNLH